MSTRDAHYLAHPTPSSRILVDGGNHDLHYKGYLTREAVQHISRLTCVNVCLYGTDLMGCGWSSAASSIRGDAPTAMLAHPP